MCIHSDKKSDHHLRQAFRLTMLIFLLIFPFSARSQYYPVKINVAITPPYSTKLTDYTNTPNKVLVTLINISVDAVTLNLYLSAELTGASGIRIYTNPNFRPTAPIVLQHGIPYTLTVSNIQEIFSGTQLVYEGITENEIVYGQGLPEDEYVICLQAFDFYTDDLLSDEAPLNCSAPFPVANIEPPYITSPWCHEVLEPITPQNVIFSWTRPAGAPLNVQYQLKLVEISSPDHDINDAMQSAAYPIFFETQVNTTSFFYGPAQPALVRGKTYAFQVTAFDPSGQIAFRNGGKSEVCSFKYGSAPLVMPIAITQDQDLLAGITGPNLLPEDFVLAPPTQISGKLLMKFPTNPNDHIDLNSLPDFGNVVIPVTPYGNMEGGTTGQTMGGLEYPLLGGNIGFSYNSIFTIANSIASNINLHNISNGANLVQHATGDPFLDNQFQWGMSLISLMNSKKYVFHNTETTQYTKPLANMKVRLVARFASFVDSDIYQIEEDFGVKFPEYGYSIMGHGATFMQGLDLTQKYHGDCNNYVNVTLDETTTDDQGNFSFNFSNNFWTGIVFVNEIDHAPPDAAVINPISDIISSVVFPGVYYNQVQNVIAGTGMDMQNILNGVSIIGSQWTPAQQQQQLMSYGGAILGKSHLGYLCLKVEVVNQKFASPDIDIFAMPGDNIQLPTQMARLKTYNMIINVKTNDEPEQVLPKNDPLPGTRVTIFRDQKKVSSEVPEIIDYEGQRLNTRTFINNGEFRHVGIDTTNIYGNALLTNLVCHAYFDPQYWIQILTRDSELVDTDYENTFYNYLERFEKLPDDQINAIQNPDNHVTYNHQYSIPTITREYKLAPLPPEIKGRTMAMSNFENIGMQGVTITLLNQDNNEYLPDQHAFDQRCNKIEKVIESYENGFFRFPELPIKKNGQEEYFFRRLLITHPLYKSRIFPPIGLFGDGQKPYRLVLGELVDLKDINLEPKELMEGYVEDEDGNPVVSYVRSGQLPYYKTEQKVIFFNPTNPMASLVREVFNVPAEPFELVKLEVRPLSSKYFPLDTTFYSSTEPAKIKVFLRLHRPVIKVVDQEGQPIANATVNIGGFEATTNRAGIARLKFAAAADQFIIKITPPSGFAPLQEPVEVPPTPLWNHLPNYVLKKAKSIKGRVTVQSSFESVEGALVFSELANTDGSPLYIEATTDPEGNYFLTGIPNDMTQLTVQVIKEGKNPSYIGTSRTVDYPQTAPLLPMTEDFSIKRVSDWDLSSIWKFPIAVTSLNEKTIPGETEPQFIMDGYIISPSPGEIFSLTQNDLKIHFSNLQVTKGENNQPEPMGESIATEALEIPLRVAQHYTGTFFNLSQHFLGFNRKKRLKLEKVDVMGLSGGLIEGQVKLNLSSFEMVHQFSGELFVGDDTLTGKTAVFNSAISSSIPNKRYSIFSLSPGLKPVPVDKFKVFNFDASASLNNSYLENNVIRLGTILHTQIPGGGINEILDLKIPAGNLVIQNTEINFEETPGNQLTFELEKWKIHTTKPWHFDINENAIVFEEVLIITGRGVDAKVKNMKVRPKTLSEGQIDLEGGLTLGGIANLELSGSLEPIFNFDSSIGHYRISLVGSTNTNTAAGRVRNLEHTDPPEILFESIGLLSNQTEAITINQTLRFYNIVDIPIQSIMTGPGFFSLKGMPELHIPKFSPPNTIINFTRVKNKLVPEIVPLQGKIIAHGNVEFELFHDDKRQSFTPGLFTSYGKVIIKPPPDEVGENPVEFIGFLTKTPSKCDIEIIKVDNEGFKGNKMQIMPAGINKMPVEGGLMSVMGDKWGILSYQAYTSDIDGLENKLLDFEVLGMIEVSGEDIEVTNIDTPFGDLKMVFNFKENSFFGSMDINNLYLGYATIYEALATVRFDENGYYFLMHLENLGLGPGGGMDGFKGALLVGKAQPINQDDLKSISNDFQHSLPDFSNFVGLFVLGECQILNKSFELFIMDVTAKAGLGMFVNVNFGASSYAIGGYGYCDVAGSVSLGEEQTGIWCGVEVSTHLWFGIQGAYQNDEFLINSCGELGLGVNLNGVCGELIPANVLATFSELISLKVESEFNVSKRKWDMDVAFFEKCPGSN